MGYQYVWILTIFKKIVKLKSNLWHIFNAILFTQLQKFTYRSSTNLIKILKNIIFLYFLKSKVIPKTTLILKSFYKVKKNWNYLKVVLKEPLTTLISNCALISTKKLKNYYKLEILYFGVWFQFNIIVDSL